MKKLKIGIQIKLENCLCPSLGFFVKEQISCEILNLEKNILIFKIYEYYCLFRYLIIGLLSNLALIEVKFIASGLIPFFQFYIKQCNDNLDAAKRLNELVLYSKKNWDEAINNSYSDDALENNSRRLQDEIYDHRSKSPLILDLYYNLFRVQSEILMKRSIEILIDEAYGRLKC